MRSAVQRIDVSRAIELFEQAGVHKIFRIGVLGGGDPCSGVLNDGPEAINGRIRLLWHHLAQCLIGILDLLLVLGLAVLRERSLGKRRVGAHGVDRFHIRSEETSGQVAIARDQALGRHQAASLIGNIEVGQIEEDLHAQTNRFNLDRKSTRLNSSHANISYAVFCLKKKKKKKKSNNNKDICQ